MIALIRRWMSEVWARLQHRHREVNKPAEQRTIERFDRIERRLDAMIVERAGRDFLERAMLNRERAPR